MITDYQKVLFPYAYNILGSAEDARDAIQDTLSHYIVKPRDEVANEKNYLIKSVINRSIQMKKQQKQVVPVEAVWLPEPIATDLPAIGGERDELAPFALLAQLEALNPKERAVFILKEGFNYSHEDIATVLDSTTENSRQLLTRAKNKLKKKEHHFVQDFKQDTATAVVRKLLSAIQSEDAEGVERLLAEDVQFYADGGRTMKVVASHCAGRQAVQDVITLVYQKYNYQLRQQYAIVNHQPAVLYYNGDQLVSCQVFEIEGESVVRIDAIIDPEKLKGLAAQRITE